MSELTPDYNPAHNYPHQTVTGVDLAPVVIHPSRWLWRIEIFIYLAILASASVSIFPFLLTAFYWPLLWLGFVLLVAFAWRFSLRTHKANPISLSVTQKIWRIKNSKTEIVVQPCDEILVWAGVIIVPVREIASGEKHRIIALPDSMDAEEWRRLRVWLRMGFRC